MCWPRSLLVVVALGVAPAAGAQPTIKNQSGGADTAVCGSATNGNDVTLNFDDVAAGDITVLFGGRGNSSDAPGFGPITAGYTALLTINSTGPKLGVWYKVQGGPPEGSVQGEGGGAAAHAVAYCAYVLDGTTVDAALFDQTSISTGQVAAVPNCSSITTQTANALVVCHSGNSVVDASPGSITNYTSFSGAGTNANDTDDITIGMARRVIAAPGVEDPAAWSTWTTGTGGSFTVAWKAAVGASANPCRRSLLGVGC